VTEHGGGLCAAQQLAVVDTVPTRQHRVDQGQQLAARVRRAGPLAKVDQRIGGLLEPEPLGQGGGQQQARVGDGVGVVMGKMAALASVILPGQRAFLTIRTGLTALLQRWTQVELRCGTAQTAHDVVGVCRDARR
jgi:hypothetical protein